MHIPLAIYIVFHKVRLYVWLPTEHYESNVLPYSDINILWQVYLLIPARCISTSVTQRHIYLRQNVYISFNVSHVCWNRQVGSELKRNYCRCQHCVRQTHLMFSRYEYLAYFKKWCWVYSVSSSIKTNMFNQQCTEKQTNGIIWFTLLSTFGNVDIMAP